MSRLLEGSYAPEMSRNQKEWLKAMDFCDLMEQLCKEEEDTVSAEWWGQQAEACYSRIQRNIPYLEVRFTQGVV